MMKRLLLACAAALALPAPAAEPEPRKATIAAPEPAPLPLRARLTGGAIAQAVSDTLAEQPIAGRSEGIALGADPYRDFSRRMDEAKVPDCLRPDGLKHQPTYFLAGLFALPFIPIAKLRGKCN